MGSYSHRSNDSANIDYDRLRRDLIVEYSAKSVAFSGGFGFLEMCDAEEASDEELVEMASQEEFNIEKYKR